MYIHSPDPVFSKLHFYRKYELVVRIFLYTSPDPVISHLHFNIEYELVLRISSCDLSNKMCDMLYIILCRCFL